MKVLTPATLDEAFEALAISGGAATPIAGGTDLLVEWPVHPERWSPVYLDLSGIDGLREHLWENGALVLGALTTYWDLIGDERARREFPVLVEAAKTVGAIQIQTRGTWAGNIVNASPAADGVPAMMAYDAEVVLRSGDAEERVRLDEFYLGYKQMRRRPDQLITAIRVPRRECSFERFVKVGSRRAQAITKVGLAIVRSSEGWRVVANSVAPTVVRCRAVERMLEDEVPVAGPEGFGAALRSDTSPIDDIRSTSAYRERVLARVLFHELAGSCDWVGPSGRNRSA